jgi:hypothetical protein
LPFELLLLRGELVFLSRRRRLKSSLIVTARRATAREFRR